jgi:cytochrome b561
MPQQENRYTRTAIALHWLVAVLMALNIALILLVNHYPDEWVRPAVDTHKSIGITVLGLVSSTC